MSDKNQARRTTAEVAFDGVDITASIQPYLLSITYADNEEDDTDDLQIRVQDRDGVWLTQWLTQAVEAAGSSSGMTMEAAFVRENWLSDGGDKVLSTGLFELDSVQASGPPATITIKGTSLSYASQIRQTLKTKAWESYNLSGIAQEMASANGMTCMYESANDPYYDRVEQFKTSDIAFLSTLCHNAGISLKATNGILVLFDQATYEGKAAIATITRGDGSYLTWSLDVGTADTQYASCRVRYADPVTGQMIEGIAYADDYDGSDEDNQQLEITARVTSVSEAEELAAKNLRLHNKFARTGTFALPGNPDMYAGNTLELSGWGAWDGTYLISQAQHTLGTSGYRTTVSLRRKLEGI